MLWLRLQFPGETAPAVSDAAILASMNEVSEFYRDNSRNRTWFTTIVLPVNIVLPLSRSGYAAGASDAAALQAARAYDAAHGGTGLYNPDNADRWIILDNTTNSNGAAGAGFVGAKGMWMYANANPHVLAHELGHNHGMGHSHSWLSHNSSPISPDGENDDYGDKFDIMGGSTVPGGHFNTAQKNTVNFLDPAQIRTITASGTYRIFRHDHRTADQRVALRIPVAGGHDYWIEYRQLQGNLSGAQLQRLRQGVTIRWGTKPLFASAPGPYLIDATPQSKGTYDGEDRHDATFPIGQTFSDAASHVHVTPLAIGGMEPNQWIDVQVQIGAVVSNRSPSLQLTAPSTKVQARTNVTFTAVASDPDGDPLHYAWDLGDQQVRPDAASVTQQWPSGGIYTVICRVSDAKGGVTNATATVVVEDSLATWTQRAASQPRRGVQDIIFAGDRFVAVGPGVALVSPDGVNWTQSNVPAPILYGVAFGNGRYVAVGLGSAGVVFSSANGLTWQAEAGVPAGPAFKDVAFGDGRFVAVGDGGRIVTTTGTTWTQVTSPTTKPLLQIYHANGRFVAVGEAGTIVTSTDGVNWQDRSVAFEIGFLAITNHAGTWIAQRDRDLWVSTDGITWEHRLGSIAAQRLTSTDGLLVGGVWGTNPTALVGLDLNRWVSLPIATGPAKLFWAVAGGNGSLVMISDDGFIYQSTSSTDATPPTILTPPVAQTVSANARVTLSVAASGGALRYQWLKNGVPLAGATQTSLTLEHVTAKDAGSYTVTITNAAGSTSSVAVTLAVEAVPVITTQPASLYAAVGTTLTLSVAAEGNEPFSYQWRRNGATIPGGTSATFSLPNAAATDSGDYDVVVRNALGTATSDRVAITISAPGRLANLSVRSFAGANADALAVGFSVGGVGSKNILIRVVGPTLRDFGVAGELVDPLVKILRGGALIAENDNWNGTAALTAASASVGAFPLSSTSRDSVLTQAFAPGSYTAEVSGAGSATGIALVEAYDLGATSTAQLVNLSARTHVGIGANILIAGFVISGAPTTVVVRAIGPTLTAFGVIGALANPRLQLYRMEGNTSALVAENDDWTTELSGAFSRVGAFALPAGSLDAALRLTLPAGSYTAHVSGVANTSGVALVEFYAEP